MMQARTINLDPEHGAGPLNITTREGMIRLVCVPGPDGGVALEAGDTVHGLSPASLAVIGRWFLAAGISLGIDP